MSKADSNKLGYIGKSPDSDRNSDEWYTPQKYIEAVRNVLGGITLDPFSSEFANKTVMAKKILTESDNSFIVKWNAKDGSVFMNPPYGRNIISKSVEKFISEFNKNSFSRGIVLINNATETKWFQSLLEESYLVCFTDHRISFISPDGKHVSNNTRGQAFLLFVSDTTRKGSSYARKFKQEFSKFGRVI